MSIEQSPVRAIIVTGTIGFEHHHQRSVVESLILLSITQTLATGRVFLSSWPSFLRFQSCPNGLPGTASMRSHKIRVRDQAGDHDDHAITCQS